MSLKSIVHLIMERDCISWDDAKADVLDCRAAIREAIETGNEDPEEILRDMLGLEPDYILDFL